MKTVRQTLTEILLDVTNEMIVEISNETISKYRKKGKKYKRVKAKKRFQSGFKFTVRFLLRSSFL